MSLTRIAGVCLALATCHGVAAQPIERGFLLRELQAADDVYRYCIFVPPDYDPARAWPVILFLHGSGERGTDGLRQTEVGIGRAIRLHPERCPAIVVMPQCRPGKYWAGDMLGLAIRCLDETDRAYNVDRSRLYITGLSMGGAGTWILGSMLSDNAAALAPICGFVSEPGQPANPDVVAKLAPVLRDTPIWAFHGAQDQAVDPDHSRELVTAIRQAGGTRVRYNEYPDGDHNVWDRAYGDPEFWTWLFAQRREPATTQPAAATRPAGPAASQPAAPE